MDFFGIGPLEVILILIIGLLIFGPQKLPQIGRDIGRALRSFRKASMSITSEIEKELEDVKKEVKDIKSEEDLAYVKKGLEGFKRELQDIKSDKELTEVKKGIEGFKKELEDIKAETDLNSGQQDSKKASVEKQSKPETIEDVGQG